MPAYRGRFAPSPTGPLHLGSLVAAMASWLDAKAHRGAWLIRIEDLDQARCKKGVDQFILKQLSDCGLQSDEPVQWQSKRTHFYEAVLNKLLDDKLVYPCYCSRSQILELLQQNGSITPKNTSAVYPGTCRQLEANTDNFTTKPLRPLPAWRFKSSNHALQWSDRRLGEHSQNVGKEVGDFILKRADGVWAYQFCVVVDDAQQRITHIVRGGDLADNTPRQIQLQRALMLSEPKYLHTPVVLGADQQKLSKQNGATPAQTERPLECLNIAAQFLGLRPAPATTLLYEALSQWTAQWAEIYS